eukprot:scaffold1166_cov261-Pinguiococcus_pyrenoidosus.AAC.25
MAEGQSGVRRQEAQALRGLRPAALAESALGAGGGASAPRAAKLRGASAPPSRARTWSRAPSCCSAGEAWWRGVALCVGGLGERLAGRLAPSGC